MTSTVVAPSRVPGPAAAAQAPAAVVLIRPHAFGPNPMTAPDNSFQSLPLAADSAGVAARAFAECTLLAQTLREHGVTVHVFDDRRTDAPDSVFPNNWFSTHDDGSVVVYPMYAANRRQERRADVLAFLAQHYVVHTVEDLSVLEEQELYLEGTGAMVLDHAGRTAYVARSRRADERVLERVLRRLDHDAVVFDAADAHGTPIYHTNVMMAIGHSHALVALDAIGDARRRAAVRDRLTRSGHEIVELGQEQVRAFAGNAIEVTGREGTVWMMSDRARRALRPDQLAALESASQIVSVPVPTIELAGGSVRCMVAGIHLRPRPHGTSGRVIAAGSGMPTG